MLNIGHIKLISLGLLVCLTAQCNDAGDIVTIDMDSAIEEWNSKLIEAKNFLRVAKDDLNHSLHQYNKFHIEAYETAKNEASEDQTVPSLKELENAAGWLEGQLKNKLSQLEITKKRLNTGIKLLEAAKKQLEQEKNAQENNVLAYKKANNLEIEIKGVVDHLDKLENKWVEMNTKFLDACSKLEEHRNSIDKVVPEIEAPIEVPQQVEQVEDVMPEAELEIVEYDKLEKEPITLPLPEDRQEIITETIDEPMIHDMINPDTAKEPESELEPKLENENETETVIPEIESVSSADTNEIMPETPEIPDEDKAPTEEPMQPIRSEITRKIPKIDYSGHPVVEGARILASKHREINAMRFGIAGLTLDALLSLKVDLESKAILMEGEFIEYQNLVAAYCGQSGNALHLDIPRNGDIYIATEAIGNNPCAAVELIKDMHNDMEMEIIGTISDILNMIPRVAGAIPYSRALYLARSGSESFVQTIPMLKKGLKMLAEMSYLLDSIDLPVDTSIVNQAVELHIAAGLLFGAAEFRSQAAGPMSLAVLNTKAILEAEQEYFGNQLENVYINKFEVEMSSLGERLEASGHLCSVATAAYYQLASRLADAFTNKLVQDVQNVYENLQLQLSESLTLVNSLDRNLRMAQSLMIGIERLLNNHKEGKLRDGFILLMTPRISDYKHELDQILTASTSMIGSIEEIVQLLPYDIPHPFVVIADYVTSALSQAKQMMQTIHCTSMGIGEEFFGDPLKLMNMSHDFAITVARYTALDDFIKVSPQLAVSVHQAISDIIQLQSHVISDENRDGYIQRQDIVLENLQRTLFVLDDNQMMMAHLRSLVNNHPIIGTDLNMIEITNEAQKVREHVAYLILDDLKMFPATEVKNCPHHELAIAAIVAVLGNSPTLSLENATPWEILGYLMISVVEQMIYLQSMQSGMPSSAFRLSQPSLTKYYAPETTSVDKMYLFYEILTLFNSQSMCLMKDKESSALRPIVLTFQMRIAGLLRWAPPPSFVGKIKTVPLTNMTSKPPVNYINRTEAKKVNPRKHHRTTNTCVEFELFNKYTDELLKPQDTIPIQLGPDKKYCHCFVGGKARSSFMSSLKDQDMSVCWSDDIMDFGSAIGCMTEPIEIRSVCYSQLIEVTLDEWEAITAPPKSSTKRHLPPQDEDNEVTTDRDKEIAIHARNDENADGENIQTLIMEKPPTSVVEPIGETDATKADGTTMNVPVEVAEGTVVDEPVKNVSMAEDASISKQDELNGSDMETEIPIQAAGEVAPVETVETIQGE